MEQTLFLIVPAAAVIALLLAWYFYRGMMRRSEGTETMQRIASHVRKGAMSYLRQQYKIVGIVFLALVIVFSIMAYGFQLQNPWVPVAFLTGGFFSGLSGFLGMKTATNASARTANAARESLNGGLNVAFRSGAVMGLVVVGLGLLDISIWYVLLNMFVDNANPMQKMTMITTTMLTFGMGASTQALFARVGGGIYTKAADVGRNCSMWVRRMSPNKCAALLLACNTVPLRMTVMMPMSAHSVMSSKYFSFSRICNFALSSTSLILLSE